MKLKTLANWFALLVIGALVANLLAVAFLIASAFFVWRSFYGMRIESGEESAEGVKAKAHAH